MFMKQNTLNLVSSGRLSIGRAAELMNLSIQDIHKITVKHKISLGSTQEQQKESYENMKKLLKK